MKVDNTNTHYDADVHAIPIGTVVIPKEGAWMGEACLLAFDDKGETALLVNLGTGFTKDVEPKESIACTAYPGATMVVAGDRR